MLITVVSMCSSSPGSWCRVLIALPTIRRVHGPSEAWTSVESELAMSMISTRTYATVALEYSTVEGAVVTADGEKLRRTDAEPLRSWNAVRGVPCHNSRLRSLACLAKAVHLLVDYGVELSLRRVQLPALQDTMTIHPLMVAV